MSRVDAVLGRREVALAQLLLGGAVLWFLIESFPRPPQTDDAYIAYRYARNLLDGQGLVYNVGRRVEGYTSFSWVLLVAAGMKAGLSAVVTSFALGVASSVGLLSVSYGYASHLVGERHPLWAALAPLLVVATASFAVWSTSGLETPLYAALVVGALWAQASARPGAAAALSALATLTRPEGVLVAAVVLGAEVLPKGADRRRGLVLAGAYALFLAALTGFRLAYFGAPLPNTFYAKVGGVPWGWALTYVAAFLLQAALPLLLPSALAVRGSKDARTAAAYVALLTMYVLAVGGDVFHYSRFFLPAVPVLVALALRGASLPGDGFVQRLARGAIPVALTWCALGAPGGFVAMAANAVLARVTLGGAARLAATAVVALAAGLGGRAAIPKPPVDLERHLPSFTSLVVFDRWHAVAVQRGTYQYLERLVQNITGAMMQRVPQPTRVAAEGIGFLGWYFRGDVVDLLGLVDPVIARSTARRQKRYGVPGHQRSNSDYVLTLSPDYIFIPGADAPFQLPAARDLWNNSRFTDGYEWDPLVGGFAKKYP